MLFWPTLHLEEVKEQVESERGKREEAEEMVSRLSQELENEEKELMEVKAAFVELSKKYTEGEEMAKLKDNVDHIKAENFENIIENEELKRKLAASLEKSEKMKKDLEKVRGEKKRLEALAKRESEANLFSSLMQWVWGLGFRVIQGAEFR